MGWQAQMMEGSVSALRQATLSLTLIPGAERRNAPVWIVRGLHQPPILHLFLPPPPYLSVSRLKI